MIEATASAGGTRKILHYPGLQADGWDGPLKKTNLWNSRMPGASLNLYLRKVVVYV